MSAPGWYDQHGVFHEGPPPTPQAPAAAPTPPPEPAPTGWYDQHGTYHEGTPPGLLAQAAPAAAAEPVVPAAPVAPQAPLAAATPMPEAAPAAQAPAAAPAAAPAPAAKKNTGLVALLITLSVLLVVTWGAIAWALLTGFSLANLNTAAPADETPAAAATQTVDVALAPAAAIGANAFTAIPWATTPASTLAQDTSGSASPADPAPITAMPGDTDSLFALPLGSTLTGANSPTSLFSQLMADTARAEAFVSALNSDPELGWGQPLTVAELEAYFKQLSYVALSNDTWVTHHAFVDGAAQPTQAVLQKGTGVMVDRFGVPRVRTVSGDPLTLADHAEGAGVSATVGESWSDFDPAEVVVIQPAGTVLDAFQIATDSGPADMAATPCRDGGLGAACDPPGPAAVIVPIPAAPANLVVPTATNCTPIPAMGAPIDYRYLNDSGETLYAHFMDPTTCTFYDPPIDGISDGFAGGWTLANKGVDPLYVVYAKADGTIVSEFMMESTAVVLR